MTENRYYVYLHRRLDNGEVFYVGKGTGERLKVTPRRSKAWYNVVDRAGGFTYEKLYENLTNKEALELEEMYIVANKATLVNSQISRDIDYNRTTWEDLFYYDETSKSCLRWKSPKHKRRIGQEAGSYHATGKLGYWNVNINGRMHKIHRIIWAMFNKGINRDSLINHIDNDSSNNKISNLEICDYFTNAIKSKTVKKKESDISSYISTKVFNVKSMSKYHSYTAEVISITRDGIRISKVFSHEKYGGMSNYLANEWIRIFFSSNLSRETADKTTSSIWLNELLKENGDFCLYESLDKPLLNGYRPEIIRIRVGKSFDLSRDVMKQFNVSHFSSKEEAIFHAKHFRNSIIRKIIDDNSTTTSTE